jgi:hypothetical protein
LEEDGQVLPDQNNKESARCQIENEEQLHLFVKQTRARSWRVVYDITQ